MWFLLMWPFLLETLQTNGRQNQNSAGFNLLTEVLVFGRLNVLSYRTKDERLQMTFSHIL